ncbi:hypothetical protein A6V39_01540 [Candidatus Mycoplasma haematobovis]|uniref:Uncharacterized protein n=1 Tax=Candidatus Mycoplasma haematobovis TaxID=432608 RepID=A0A1A9QG67_9MOLU|nr:hypothetical protein [Candidatus Mycoplasma haematobovis]OAL10729.1 hypothetical protein A6V39_01540 [Candidatus Mycoplasma haematobovis]
MSYIKGYSFLKRTFVLLSPLFLVTLASKELAFYAPVATLSPILSDPKEEKDSIINLVSSLNKELPEGVEDYGSLKIQKSIWGEEIWIEESNPLSTFSHRSDFKFKEADEIITKEETDNKQRYVLSKDKFEQIQDKGDINVLTTFELGDNKIPVTHIVPLSDLTTVSSKVYTIVTTKTEDLNQQANTYFLTVTKDSSKQEITFELDATLSIYASSGRIGWDTSSLIIKSFYILFNDNPPLDPKSYFTINQNLESDVVGETTYSNRFKKVLLNKWNNKSKPKNPPSMQEEPTYEFNTNNDFWTSTCSDPYKVGGFIDKDLKSNGGSSQTSESPKENVENNGSSRLAKQKKSWIEVKPFQKEQLKHNEQYFWKQIKNKGAYVPHDESTASDDYCKGVELETKTKLGEYINRTKTLTFEPKEHVEKRLAPEPLIKEINNGSGSSGLQNGDSPSYPQHKIVQSSFRAWGNAYLTEQNENLKEKGIYSSQFELANHSNHTFTIKIDKNTWTEHLTKKTLEQQKKESKKLNESQDIFSLLEVHYPLSFSFFDPVSSYLRKHSLLLKTELDLSNLYLTSSYSKEVFRFDIGNENRVIGQDYQGFNPLTYSHKKKDYGLDGKLSLIAGLELDIEKNLKINLTTRVSGFVNTKNPSCDLRHRLYKIDNGNYSSKQSLDKKWNCSEEFGWKYREHIHIPSFLVISLTGEPEVVSFYVDKDSGVKEETKDVKKQEGEEVIKTLSELSSKLNERKITTIIETDESNKAEVYFKDIAAYGKPENGFPLLDLSSWWSSGQNVYYWYPKRAKGKLTNIDFSNLKTITLHLDGSKNSYNSFFHSNHFNTLTTLCVNNKYILSSSSSSSQECGDENKYEKVEKDKSPSELHDLWGSQTVDVDVKDLQSKTDEKQAYEVKFRVTYNRADRRTKKEDTDNDKFEKIKTKLETFFKTDTKEPTAKDIPNVSMLAFWYSVFFWKDKNKNDLHYATQIRPIGLITKEIKNANAHETIGAAGSAGFEISKFVLKYSKPLQK